MPDIAVFGLDIGPWSEWAAAVASVGSVWAASYFARRSALDGAQLQIDAANAAEERQRIELRRRVAAALLGELEGIETRVANQNMADTYRQLAVQFTRPGARPTTWATFNARQSYTAIYDSLAEKLGCFDTDLARQIAGFYTEMKGIIDTINNASEMNLSLFPPPQIAAGANKLANDLEALLANGQSLKKRLGSLANLT